MKDLFAGCVRRLPKRVARLARRGLGTPQPGGDSIAAAAGRFWGRAFEQGGVRTWMAEERCRLYINRCVAGSPHEWPMEWFKRVHCAKPFALGLSLGCGDGPLERDVRRKRVCEAVVGVDISGDALRLARERSAAEGLDGITYCVGDLNALSLPPWQYDIVFFHQSLHHVANLEHCLDQVASTLKPGGLLYLDEYVGPSRTDWNDDLLAAASKVYRELPRRLRLVRRVPLPVQQDDPSEAIRSSEILATVGERFQVFERHDYGGNILALLHSIIRWERLLDSEKAALLDHLVAEEMRLLGNGEQAFYSVVLGRRQG